MKETAADPRTAGRANVFLAATLVAGGNSRPVRMRNISARGALLDGPALPPEGAVVHLRRGSLSIDGEVAWQSGEQCGLRFDDDVVVADWVRRVEHSGQARVDDIFALLKRLPRTDVRQFDGDQASDSLASISTDLADCSQRLASIPSLVARHSDELLRLDSLVHRLTNLGDSVPPREETPARGSEP